MKSVKVPSTSAPPAQANSLLQLLKPRPSMPETRFPGWSGCYAVLCSVWAASYRRRFREPCHFWRWNQCKPPCRLAHTFGPLHISKICSVDLLEV